jgi:sugar lactone lactonase YvrE
MIKGSFLLLTACAALSPLARAGETKNWVLDSRADFEKGSIKKLSLRSDGKLSLAPALGELFDASTPYLWAVAQDSKGNLYAGGGGPNNSKAKLFVIDASGKSKTLTELEGMEIHAIAVDKKDQVYAATSPDGKIYRVAANGKSTMFYDPKAKYIWAMAFASNGDLFVATGDNGEIHRVTTAGAGSVFFKSDETHARSMTIDANDNLIVGTEPSGLILRVSKTGKGFVLHQASKREVTAVAVDKNGAIYAAAVGGKPTAPQLAPISLPPPPASGQSTGGSVVVSGRPAASPVQSIVLAGSPAIAGGSEVYRIDPGGFPKRVWTDANDIVYAIAFDAEGRPLLGTGNKGNIQRLDSDSLSTLLLSLAPTQVTGLLSAGGKVFAITGNIGNVYRLGPELEKEGTFESEALDAGMFSIWGRLSNKSALNGGAVRMETRSGNLDRPQNNWSPWAPVKARVASPPSRFLQYRVTIARGGNGASPELTSVEAAYLPKNIPPEITAVESTPANYRYPASTITLNIPQSTTLTLPPIGQNRTSASSVSSDSSAATLNYAKGYMGARWKAKDENGDTLQFKIEIRGVAETEWKLLREKSKDRFLSWDSTAFPDGEYKLRVIATDAPSNPPAEALTASAESDPFTIDNTPPHLSGLHAAATGKKIAVRWKATDALTTIEKAEYSVNGGDWTMVEPTTKLSDSKELDYVLTVDKTSAEVTIAVRVTDEADNSAVEKIIVK